MSYNYTFLVIIDPNGVKYGVVATDSATYYILILYLPLTYPQMID